MDQGAFKNFEEFALENSHDNVVLYDHGKIRFVNQHFVDILGVPRAELIGKSDYPFLATNNIQEFQKLLLGEDDATREFYINGRGMILSKVHFRHYTKEQVCVIFQILPGENDTSRLAFFNLYDKHTTQKWSIVEYIPSMSDYKFLFMSHPAWIDSADRMKISNKYSEQFGHFISTYEFTKEELEWFDKCHKRVNEQCPTYTHKTRPFTAITGAVYYYDTVISYIGTTAEGHPLYLDSYYDVTEKTNFEQELKQKKKDLDAALALGKMLQGFFDFSPLRMGSVEWNEDWTDCTYRMINKAVAAAFHKLPEDMIGKKASLFQPKENLQIIAEHCRSITVQQPIKFVEIKMKNPTCPEEYLYFLAYFSCEEGRKFSYILQEVTETKALESALVKAKDELEETVKDRTKALQNALQVKSSFLANMSHEIRTPLNGLMSVLTLVASTNLDDDQRSLLRVGKVCGEQLLVVINDILDLSKIEENKVILENVPFSLRNVLYDSFEVILHEAVRKGLELICDIHPLLQDTVVGDACRLRQIVINLLSNAVKFSNKGDIILRASCQEVGDGMLEVTISVSDEGIGISEAAKERIFSPFSQADSSMNRRYGGTGLGLSISKKLAELMGGKMWFDSVEGEGSTFCFTFLTSVIPNPPEEAWTAKLANLRGKRLIVVDKSKSLLRDIEQKLHRWGIDTSACLQQIVSNLS